MDELVGVAVLGSTGSVGTQTLEVVDALPDRFRVTALAAKTSSERFLDQVRRYRPAIAAISEPPDLPPVGTQPLATGPNGLIAAATHPDVDIVVVATSGHVAIEPAIRAIEAGKVIALANKETLVCAGSIIMPLAQARGVEIRTVDSEHSAIWQALGAAPHSQVRRLILTASGGPFRHASVADLSLVTADQAMQHPTWSMGGKITIDSATLMNKGLEIIEAHWLFAMPFDRIDVLIHPESIVHSLVEFIDGSQIAQLGMPDMKLPIQYALTYPDRAAAPGTRLDLAEVGRLHFSRPDEDRFPALRLAREAGLRGGTFPTVLSAADEVAVSAFTAGAIRFTDIPGVIEATLAGHEPEREVTLEAISAADVWARRAATTAVERIRASR